MQRRSVWLAALGACWACSVSHITAGDGDRTDAGQLGDASQDAGTGGADAESDAPPDAQPDVIDAQVSDAADADATTTDPTLMAWWSFEEGAGDSATDSVSGIKLDRVGASWDPAGKSGGAAAFDGQDDYFELVAPGAQLDFGSGDFTLSAWVKSDAFAATTSHQMLVLARGIGATPQHGYRLFFQWTDFHKHYLSANIADGSDSAGLSPLYQEYFVDRAGQWIHLAMTRDGQQLAVWVNGQLHNSTIAPSVGDISVEGQLNDRFRIGALPYQGLWPFEGSIDEVRIYTRALDDRELAALAAPD